MSGSLNPSFRKRRFGTQFLKPTWCGISCVLGYSSLSVNRCSWICSSRMARGEFYFQGWYLYQSGFAFRHLHLHSSQKHFKMPVQNCSVEYIIKGPQLLAKIANPLSSEENAHCSFFIELGCSGARSSFMFSFLGKSLPDINSCSTQMISSSLSESVTLE